MVTQEFVQWQLPWHVNYVSDPVRMDDIKQLDSMVLVRMEHL